jgi:drug/metabolite transporter (DMT)-like permease
VSALRGRALAVYASLCAVWGSTWLAIKIGLRDLPPLRFAGARMALAFLLLTPFVLARRGAAPTRRQAAWIAWAGFLQIGVAYACVFVAEQWIDSGLSALLFATFPIFVGLFAHYLLPEEPLTARRILAAALGLCGVAVIEAPAALAAFSYEARTLLAGGGLMLLSSISAAYANVINKKHFGGVSPIHNVWGQTLVGASLLMGLALVFERGARWHWTPSAAGSLAYLAVLGTALPFAGLFWLIRRVPVAVIGSIPVVDTVIAVLLGHVVLGEPLSWRLVLGGALILVGVILAARPAGSAVAAVRIRDSPE